MDQAVPMILPDDLSALIGGAATPVVVDLRSAEEISAAERLIPGALWRSSADVQTWGPQLPRARGVVVFDLAGGETSRAAVAALRRQGLQASRLDGGFAAWRERMLPTRRVVATNDDKWVTRERPKIDRLACPWLIRRFIDADAEILYVPPAQVLAVAQREHAIAFDVPDVELTHSGPLCSFDAFLEKYHLEDACLARLAEIIRAADTDTLGRSPQAAGLLAISLGLAANIPDDQELLKSALTIYDALYTWCRSLHDERHAWQPEPDPNETPT
jgi:rhodanese-related sulfurtransferase